MPINSKPKANGNLNDYQSFWILDAHMRESESWMADGRFNKLVERWAETATGFVTDKPADNRLALAEKLKVFARFVEELNGSMMDEREERMARAIAEDVGRIRRQAAEDAAFVEKMHRREAGTELRP